MLKPEWAAVPVQAVQCRMWRIQEPDDCDQKTLLQKLTKCLFGPRLLAKIKVMNIYFLL